MTDGPTWYEPPPRRRRRRERSILDSPLLSIALAAIVLGVGAVVFVPGLRPGGPAPTGAAAATGTPAPTGPAPSPTFARPTPSPGPTFLPYRVRSGDTLNSIARQFRTTGRSLAWWNRGTYPSLDPESAGYDPNTIRVGWVLVVLPDTVVDDTNPPTPSPGPSVAPTL